MGFGLVRVRVVERFLAVGTAVLASVACVWATPAFVEHLPENGVYGEAAGVTMRDPLVVREGDGVTLWIRIGYSFYYDDVAVYYTTDGSEPLGSYGVGEGSTAALTFTGGDIVFVRNEPSENGNIDLWRATLPAEAGGHGDTIRYTVSAWQGGSGVEVFGNNYGCEDGTCEDPAITPAVWAYEVRLAWPGRGYPSGDPATGYPPVYFWKEEAVVGNNYINVMLDQNGTVYDVYYPSAGCVQGMGTKNEGYVDGVDTYPPGLPPGHRGQMNVNQVMGGLRVDGVTYWLSNEGGGAYSDVAQGYVADTNVVWSTARLTAEGNDILVEQYDFSPKGIAYPADQGGNLRRGLYAKRYVLTNQGGGDQTVQFYVYGDFALNGGDNYDGMFADAERGAMVAYDRTGRTANEAGEYNPTSFDDYVKDVSVYLAASVKLLDEVGGASGVFATDFWRDTSDSEGQGWVGLEVNLPAGTSREINLLVAGGFDDFPDATGTYDYQIAPVLDWFADANLSVLQQTTETYWRNWLAEGVTIDTPDDWYDEVFKRGLLGTALHLDGRNGGIIAGMHNGAYPFVWPRDGVWAAVTLDRTGHVAESGEIYRFLRDVAYRGDEAWGKGFWYQKYTTDGYIVWSAPQVDETSVVPWGVYYRYRVTGDEQFLSDSYGLLVHDAARASSEDSQLDARLYYDDPAQLMYSMNLWEDQFNLFVYSNATVVRGLRDAAMVADLLGHDADRDLFASRADAIEGGMRNRLSANIENTDISLLGVVYPFDVVAVDDPLAVLCVDRINGVAGDTWGNIQPLVNGDGEWAGLIDRYWGDSYWNGGPWFLSTLWYGAYYAERQDVNPGVADIDNHKYRIDLLLDRLGPVGFGAEQVAPSYSLLYPGEGDFVLQTAWPNAWESMSFIVDAMMLFLDYTPDAPGNTLRIEPKLPSDWGEMTFANVRLGDHRVDVVVRDTGVYAAHVFVNRTGEVFDYETYVRLPAGESPVAVTQDGETIAYDFDGATGRVRVSGAVGGGVGHVTEVRVTYGLAGDVNCDGVVNNFDIDAFVLALTDPAAYEGMYADCDLALADVNGDGLVNNFDIDPFVALLTGG